MSLEFFDPDDAADDLLAFAASDVQRFGVGYSFDDQCGMVGPGELVLMWGRASTGKSTWLLNVINNTPNVPTVIFNMEMTPRRQAEWLACMSMDYSIPAFEVEEVLSWGPDDERYPEVVAGLRSLKTRFPYLQFTMPSLPTISDLARGVDTIEDKCGWRPQRVFIDHVGLMDGAKDYEGMTKTTSGLHAWALNEGLVVIALQQTGRGGGDAGRNDGHLPVTLSSGVFAGEADADWIWGMYRPEKDPKFLRPRHAFTKAGAYEKIQEEYSYVRGINRLQLIKNRPYGEVREHGIPLRYDTHSRRLIEGA